MNDEEEQPITNYMGIPYSTENGFTYLIQFRTRERVAVREQQGEVYLTAQDAITVMNQEIEELRNNNPRFQYAEKIRMILES